MFCNLCWAKAKKAQANGVPWGQGDYGICRKQPRGNTYLDIGHDKRDDFILDTLSHQAQTGASCHAGIPYTLIPVLTRFLLGELLQQHAYQRLQRLSDEVVIRYLFPVFLRLSQHSKK